MSYLHEEYLKLLAAETHLTYWRLGALPGLTAVLTDASLTVPRKVPSDLRWTAGLVALLGILHSLQAVTGRENAKRFGRARV